MDGLFKRPKIKIQKGGSDLEKWLPWIFTTSKEKESGKGKEKEREKEKRKKEKKTPPTGIEPAIFGLGGRRLIH